MAEISPLRRRMIEAQMQDIGGVRAVLNSYQDVVTLADSYRVPSTASRFAHRLVREKDYISSPRSADGYRSLHLIYEYRNRLAPMYDGLLLEMQLRTKLQHTWATAVETTGLYLNQPLKFRRGDREWQDFFALTSSAFAYQENLPLVPLFASLSEKDTYAEVSRLATKLRVADILSGFALGADIITRGRQNGYYHIIVLNTAGRTVDVGSFSRGRLQKRGGTLCGARKAAFWRPGYKGFCDESRNCG